ncbi:MAG: hypothetical protein BGO26_12835 [Actinobacteria bacterium 69-20]|jgi:deazaflavin-dependent oxidoreductase (nitroreductase family)|nr:nitroreductase family deazaflavin-dependent oxidoreductase [Actinomycetota bacterium]OJV23672.1 MAG: hypothetical protein BGO26_12835 [Actinobacteria bacterium 69-20]
MRAMNQRVIEKFRTGGDMGGMPRARMLLLTTTGRHTGQPHTTPMMFVRVDGALLVVASNSGASRDPDWYCNLVANPSVTVEIGTVEIGTGEIGSEHFAAIARPVGADRRSALWQDVIGQIPMYAQHQASTSREIPLVELIRPESG